MLHVPLCILQRNVSEINATLTKIMPCRKGLLTRRKHYSQRDDRGKFNSHPSQSAVATPLKHLDPTTFNVTATATFDSLTPAKQPMESDDSTFDLEIPSNFSSWKIHLVGHKIVIYRLLSEGLPDNYSPICITHMLSFCNGNWQLWVHGLLTCSPHVEFPTKCTNDTLKNLLMTIDLLHVCEGVPDPSMIQQIGSSDILDKIPTLNKHEHLIFTTVRNKDCVLLLSGQADKCDKCAKLKDRLRQKVHRSSKRETKDAKVYA